MKSFKLCEPTLIDICNLEVFVKTWNIILIIIIALGAISLANTNVSTSVCILFVVLWIVTLSILESLFDDYVFKWKQVYYGMEGYDDTGLCCRPDYMDDDCDIDGRLL